VGSGDRERGARSRDAGEATKPDAKGFECNGLFSTVDDRSIMKPGGLVLRRQFLSFPPWILCREYPFRVPVTETR
jgi:hypothetical protein